MAQQTFSGVPGAFAAGAVLTAAEQELIRDYMIAQIKEGMTGDTGEILPMIMDLTNNRIVLDAGGLEFSDGTLQTTAPTDVLSINAQTGTTYTFVLADAGKMVTSSNGSAQTLTVPPNSSVAYAIGTQIIVHAIGSGTVSLAEGSGVTINSVDSNKDISGQWAAAALIKSATDAWSLIGALA